MSHSDTIVAIATPAGRGGVAVLRISGSAALTIGRKICGTLPKPREARMRRFVDASNVVIDFGLLLVFKAPASFTGEDVIELQGHGGPVVAAMLMERVIELGARRARPGEFSERAFLNDKLDLAQAEAIADLIDSGTRQAANAAVRSLEGAFSESVHDLVEQLTTVRIYVEAAIDFPEEEIDFLADKELEQRLTTLDAGFSRLNASAQQGRLLNDGLTVVLRGAPNAGKSSLLNALAGADTAIVTELAGTTRDVLRELIDIDGMPVTLLDTAGVRDTEDPIEREGVRRANAASRSADLVVLVEDASRHQTPADLVSAFDQALKQIPDERPSIQVANKIDTLTTDFARELPATVLCISATEGSGLNNLREAIARAAGRDTVEEGTFSARQRHLDAITVAYEAFNRGRRQLNEAGAGELLAEELRLAQGALGEITGELTSDDLLGRIFGSFCIGK